MNSQASQRRNRAWPHRLLESAALSSALLLASSAMAAGAAVATSAPVDADPANKTVVVKELQQAKTYSITSPDVATLHMDAPKLPDITGYTEAAAAKKIVRSKPGKVRVSRMMDQVGLKEFIGGDNKMAEWVARQQGIPQAIIVEGGYMSLQDLAKKVPKQFLNEVSPGVYVARLPILVKADGILEIDKKTKELRLSQEKGSFLVVEGKLFTSNTQVNGWREKDNSLATFRKPDEFRPFLLSWGGSEIYIINTKVASLGYDKSKSYGVSVSQYTPNMVKQMNKKDPTGWIVGSEFSDMWYGFYCYETRDFVVKGSTYRNNIVYGIDPHDRSHGLIIAENDVYGTKKKHGIIISREVNDSFIFNNRSHDNKLSGMVLDRNSVNNVVAYNEIFQNHTDGITLYESGDNLLWGNKVVANRRHGIRVRNSVNIKLYENKAMANGLLGVYGHIKDLSNTDRDIALDPFDTKVSLIVVGGELTGNNSGPLSIDSPLSIELYRVAMLAPTKSNGISLNGVLGDRQDEILDLLVRQQKAVLIDPVESQKELQD